ncbi:CehA/McbA family metallohydrolase [Devosia sp. YIM 151766]|uniref:CehA/McbA family metallohydrolase n=1 Tax=Devosia sp. YIM 151766 TaxID=3017325 RepID=UPI00255CD900|nr:CehA/McbA family metallohydrolase [Devosia sp. YIM 151766]WIY52002.1 CehA/McbA family metallohydrolase [Devosia sp. YIM 151766]
MTKITTRITRADQSANPYFYIPFTVPEGTTRIDVALAYPKAEDCVIDLGAFDPRDAGYPTPDGFRGWSGGARDSFFIATDDATPGYIHGDIQPGTWNVILGLYKVPEAGAEAIVTITLDAAPRALAPQPARTWPVRQKAGWYKGDLHCHTYHSDARGAPELLHEAARQAGLDFLAVADHNTITQRRYFHPNSSPDLVFVRAMEVTTAIGHANVYGVDDWIDFRMTRPSDAHVLEKLVHDKGGLLSINHDKPTIPWDYDFPVADCQEVWQSTWLAWNWVSLERYQQRLAAGMKLSAIGGSDYHQPDRVLPEGPLVLARPTTMLWLPELSEDAILAAMKSGHGYITESPTGPHLEIHVGNAVMGDTLSALPEVTVIVHGAPGDQLVLIDATGPVATLEIDSDDWQATIPVDPQKFLRAEIIAKASRSDLIAQFTAALDGRDLPWQLQGADLAEQPVRRALSNPIYVRG